MIKQDRQQSKWDVSQNENGSKLIDFIHLKLKATYSKRQLKQWIESNLCSINGRVERFASTTLSAGNEVELQMKDNLPHPKLLKIDPERILHEDDFLFIYDKPSGVASDCPKFMAALALGAPALQLVHRLDKGTSGVLVFAKSNKAYLHMVELFRQRQVHKTYLAIVDGIPKSSHGIIDNYLGKIHSYLGQTLWGSVSSEKGQHARTEWQLKKAGHDASLLICHPITGRTHQIRVHLSEAGHPILGDYQYGRIFRSTLRPQRCLLHASDITFAHPTSGKELRVEAPIPDDFKEALQRIIP